MVSEFSYLEPFHQTAESGKKMKLSGYSGRRNRYPFVVEIIEENGEPCSKLARTSARFARGLFGIENRPLEVAA